MTDLAKGYAKGRGETGAGKKRLEIGPRRQDHRIKDKLGPIFGGKTDHAIIRCHAGDRHAMPDWQIADQMRQQSVRPDGASSGIEQPGLVLWKTGGNMRRLERLQQIFRPVLRAENGVTFCQARRRIQRHHPATDHRSGSIRQPRRQRQARGRQPAHRIVVHAQPRTLQRHPVAGRSSSEPRTTLKNDSLRTAPAKPGRHRCPGNAAAYHRNALWR